MTKHKMMTTYDIEEHAGGMMTSFNVQGVFYAKGLPYKHATIVFLPQASSKDDTHAIQAHYAGIIGFDREGKIPKTVEEEVYQAMDNIEVVIRATLQYLEQKGYGKIPWNQPRKGIFSYIAATRVDVTDLAYGGDINRVYGEQDMPAVARTMVQVAKLPLDARVEITVQAYFATRKPCDFLDEGTRVGIKERALRTRSGRKPYPWE